ncbi:RagB/SusD family nutrient uptake outer membrane protein [Arenibacter palladensis]|uniref:RagB/SusD family nutrient uptake outer membrane protein n=1 Tax=Arenibacter palladensis TaxID=237373 RepID=UPI0026E38391|nr:RagB/SusD family nutrient uptake outer membrane protein [Arenibacter palladensis]MDO6605199.1 RagB/SusD family nutrient uptake outer membrane protein [Arenibacter palladensis]
MKINNIKIQVFSILVLLSIGCDDKEFLTEYPKTFYTTDNIFSSETQLDQILITTYSGLRSLSQNPQILGMGTDVFDSPSFRTSQSFTDYSRINAETTQFRTIYDSYYNEIKNANTVLSPEILDGVSFESENSKKYIIAQARFFRAYCHGMLAELFGGVPIVTELVNEPRYDYVRATREETYQFAIDELEAIVNDLPETTPQGGRLVKGVALHYLSEFYLGLGIETSNIAAYDNAIKYASDIIDGDTYALMTERFGTRMNEENTITGGADVWWDLFRLGNQNYSDGNKESIWTYQFDFNAYVEGDRNSFMDYPYRFGPVYRWIAGFDGLGDDAGGYGIASYAPTPLIEFAIWDESISAGDQRNAEHNISRKIFYNDPVNYPDLAGKQVPQEVIEASDAGRGGIFPIFYKLNTDKYQGLDQGENRRNIFRDKYAIRLPETILLRAEAYHRKGENQNAADDINLIRARAQCEIMATAADIDINYILDERARELYAEESRWNTLLRMGGTVATDRIKEYALHPHVALTLTFDYNLWPIPQSAIDRNKDVKMEQNPGWNR